MSEIERQELERLLASRHLKGRRSREALQFLCRKHWDGEAVTQYDLSQELYGNVENQVGARNLVKSLREKLELHYATEGRDAALVLQIPKGGYNIVFLAREGDVDDRAAGLPAGAREETSGRSWSPSPGMVAAILALSILIIVILTMQGFSKSRGAVVHDLSIDGNDVVGQSVEGRELWRETFPAPVYRVVDLDDDSTNRFAVLYGGLESPESPPAKVTPHLAILSPKGDILENRDLLKEFNPFREDYDERYFRFGPTETIDFDKDGHQDLLVTCKHLYYPNIIYSYCGGKSDITGAFANSGKIKDLVLVEPVSGESSPGVIGLAINNMMGEQIVAFRVPLLEHRVSPDQKSDQYLTHQLYRPTGLIRLAAEPWSMEPGNLLKINGVDRSVLFDSMNTTLSTDPWFRKGRETDQARNRFVKFYPQVLEARRQVGAGMIDEGQSTYDLAFLTAPDEPLRLYVLLDAARSLKKAGLAEEALDWLPQNPAELFHPRRPMLLRGELLTILGEYEAAGEAYLDAEYIWYSYKGFVQAAILEGLNREDLSREIVEHYSLNTGLQTTDAWLKIPALLRGEGGEANSADDGPSPESGLVDVTEDTIRYRQESIFWNAVVELESGVVPHSRFDEILGPMEYDDVFPLKIEALEALRHLVEDGLESALPSLEASYRALKAAALRDSEAIIPLVHLAYTCGFAADQAGRPDLAREALGDAVGRYPFGLKFKRAKSILERPPDGN